MTDMVLAPRLRRVLLGLAAVIAVGSPAGAQGLAGPSTPATSAAGPAVDPARARLEVPRAGRRAVTLDGAEVWRAGGPATGALPAGAERVPDRPDAVWVWVGPGRWRVVAE